MAEGSSVSTSRSANGMANVVKRVMTQEGLGTMNGDGPEITAPVEKKGWGSVTVVASSTSALKLPEATPNLSGSFSSNEIKEARIQELLEYLLNYPRTRNIWRPLTYKSPTVRSYLNYFAIGLAAGSVLALFVRLLIALMTLLKR